MDKVTYRISQSLECAYFDIDHGKNRESSCVGELWFQSGPIKEHGVNGVQIRDVIDMLINRLKDLDSKYPSKYNQETIKYLLLAQLEQDKRTRDREKRGVEGENKA